MNPGAQTWIPSENEWYKAAYYDATKGGTGGYWLYPTQSDALGGNTIGVPNSANYGSAGLTDVGAYGANSDSFYGTNDQGGSVFEWMSAPAPGFRGGGWSYGGDYLASSVRFPDSNTSFEWQAHGFRVASVPEPSCVVLTLLASGVLVSRRKR